MLGSSEDDGGRGVGLAGDPGAVEGVGHQQEGHQQHDEPSDLTLHRVRWVSLLLLGLALLKEVKVPHVSGEDGGDSYPREDTHDWSQHQHQTDHHSLGGAGFW